MRRPPRTRTKRCVVCAGDIPADARKCTACNSFQDWRGAFHLDPAIMSLVVAFVALLPAAIKEVTAALTPQNSHLVLGVPHEEAGSYFQFVSNTGIRPGAITGAYIEVTDLTTKRTPSIIRLQAGTQDQPIKIIPPKSSALVRYDFIEPPPIDKLELPRRRDRNCQMRSFLVDFRGEETTKTFNLDCILMNINLLRAQVHSEEEFRRGVQSILDRTPKTTPAEPSTR